MTKRVREHSIEQIELGEDVGSAMCYYPKCKVLLVWEATEGGTIHDGAEFWTEECRCHEEDKQKYCAKHREIVVCDVCDH